MPKAQSGKVTTFDSEIHLMISEDVSQKGDMSFELKVMSWIIDGKKHKPQLTKQQMSLGEDGSKRGGKAKGLTLSDLDKILEKLPEVYKALGGNAERLAQLVTLMGGVNADTEPF